jgi:hypothetical protein
MGVNLLFWFFVSRRYENTPPAAKWREKFFIFASALRGGGYFGFYFPPRSGGVGVCEAAG